MFSKDGHVNNLNPSSGSRPGAESEDKTGEKSTLSNVKEERRIQFQFLLVSRPSALSCRVRLVNLIVSPGPLFPLPFGPGTSTPAILCSL